MKWSVLMLVLAKQAKEVLDWLCPPTVNPTADQELWQSLRTKETATWIFQHPSYQTWYNESGAFLWLYGQSRTHHVQTKLISSGRRKVRSNVWRARV